MVDEPPITITEGEIIKDGFDEELDSMKRAIADGKAWIAGLENTERERTGIKALKVTPTIVPTDGASSRFMGASWTP